MKINRLVVFVFFLLLGCDYPIQGTLKVNLYPLKFKDSSNQSFEMNPGDHAMEIQQGISWGKFKLKSKIVDSNGKSRTLKFETAAVPQSAADKFYFTSNETGQAFDVDGHIETVETQSDQMEYSEGCAWIQSGKTGYYSGRRIVRYHMQTKSRTFCADFKIPQTESVLANYLGKSVETNKVIDDILPCFSP